jgi:hypothetical protein
MTKFRDFGTGTSSPESEPISFKLHGEEFYCVPEIQGSVLLRMVGSTSDENPARSAAMITEFFEHVLTDESVVRFNELIESKDRTVSIQTLGEITGWVIEEYSDRPEAQPEA